MISEIVDVEIANVLYKANRDGRIDAQGLGERLDAYRNHSADDGPIGVAPLSRDILDRACRIVLDTDVNTLDAIHIASAQLLNEATDEDVVFLSLDKKQAVAAEQAGLRVFAIPKETV